MTPPCDAPQFPDLRPVRLIDRGSYGVVWLCQTVTGRWRAVKIVEKSAFDCIRPYDREFAGTQRIEELSQNNPHLNQIFHVGRIAHNDAFYCVLELADDLNASPEFNPETYAPKTLRSLLAHTPTLPLPESIDIARSIALGLQFLHGHQLVHRDLKPSNVIFVNGIAKLADFGLVAPSQPQASFVGTPGYIPPEGPGRPQGDLYALGKILYQLTWGAPAEHFPSLPASAASLPHISIRLKLNELIDQACDPNPNGRFSSAREFLDALDSIPLPEQSSENRAPSLAQKIFEIVLEPRPLPSFAIQVLGLGALVSLLFPPAAWIVPASLAMALWILELIHSSLKPSVKRRIGLRLFSFAPFRTLVAWPVKLAEASQQMNQVRSPLPFSSLPICLLCAVPIILILALLRNILTSPAPADLGRFWIQAAAALAAFGIASTSFVRCYAACVAKARALPPQPLSPAAFATQLALHCAAGTAIAFLGLFILPAVVSHTPPAILQSVRSYPPVGLLLACLAFSLVSFGFSASSELSRRAILLAHPASWLHRHFDLIREPFRFAQALVLCLFAVGATTAFASYSLRQFLTPP